MKLCMIACSRKAHELMISVNHLLDGSGYETECITKCRSLAEISIPGKLSEYVAEKFQQADAIVFFSAVGIAVRTIAPYLQHKSKDPAVIVIDETGKYCISLLSGHAGGANALAGKLADLIGAELVITTATDREGKFAVDEFARKNGLTISDWSLAKEISADLLEDKTISMISDFQIDGECPRFLKIEDTLETADVQAKQIYISNKKEIAEKNRLQLIPQNIVVGIGCKKNTPYEKIKYAVLTSLSENQIDVRAVCAAASIDLKKSESGILQFCEEYHIPFLTYSTEELQRVEGDFTPSEFVKSVTGVDNVCERSAKKTGAQIIRRKKAYDGVTVALAEKEQQILIEGSTKHE